MMTMTQDCSCSADGRFGKYGGQYVPDTLLGTIQELAAAYEKYKADPDFTAQLEALWHDYVGRPSPLYLARTLSERVGATVYLKREDLNHTGSHKIYDTLGQGLLAQKMGKPRMLAETGAGQHGVATATAAALLGMQCVVYMGEEDVRRQHLNVFRMQLLGAEVVPVSSGTGTLKDAINEAFRYWLENIDDTFYCFGSVCGPHPFPTMVRDFQSVIGREVRRQCMEKAGRLPDYLVACVGGGSNAMGLFYDFLPDTQVRLIGVEAGGRSRTPGDHSATLTEGSYGILHGAAEYVLQDEDGQVLDAHSIAAGLDYPGVGPEHCMLKDTGRARYEVINDAEAVQGFMVLSESEGIIPALESSHAVAQVLRMADELSPEDIVVVNISGRGDKDCEEVQRLLEAGILEQLEG